MRKETSLSSNRPLHITEVLHQIKLGHKINWLPNIRDVMPKCWQHQIHASGIPLNRVIKKRGGTIQTFQIREKLIWSSLIKIIFYLLERKTSRIAGRILSEIHLYSTYWLLRSIMGVPGICHAATAVTSGAKRGVFFDFDSTMRLGSKQLNMYILREFTLSLLFFSLLRFLLCFLVVTVDAIVAVAATVGAGVVVLVGIAAAAAAGFITGNRRINLPLCRISLAPSCLPHIILVRLCIKINLFHTCCLASSHP